MSTPTLVIRFADLEAMEAAMTRAHDDLVEQIAALRRGVDAELVGWARDTASRQAQLRADNDLARGVESLAEALAKVHAALAGLCEDAHAAEVRNVAILD